MKYTILIVCALILGCTSLVFSQFEGVIDMNVVQSVDDSTYETAYTLFVKKDLMATEMKGKGEGTQQGKFIFRGDKKVLWIVNHEEKNFLEISLKDDESSKGKGKKPEAVSTSEKIKKTGKTQKILGYLCEELLVEDGNEVSHIWATSKLGNIYEGLAKSFGELGGKEMEESDGWEKQLADMKIFPLKIETTKDGKLEQKQEVTRIEEKSVPASTFEPPKGYKKQAFEFDMEKMMKQMQEQMEKEGKEDDEGVDEEKLMREVQEKMKQMEEAQQDTSDGGR